MESTPLDSADFTTLLAQQSDNTNSIWHSEFYRKNTKDKILEWEGTSRSVSATQLIGRNNSPGEINHLTLEHIRG